jgi:hypothetical protein
MRIDTAAGRPLALSLGSGASAVWQPLGPQAVTTTNYGLITGRVSSIALDPADPTGNSVYLGTTGGGVWFSQNAGSPANSVVFTPLTDSAESVNDAVDLSISIGAVSVQPGGTGVILAGTGDPNDALDSYYGAGILRSQDRGNTWSLIQTTGDQVYSFVGEGFAGFAWSTLYPELVVAAVSEAYQGTLVNAQRSGVSSAGLYYSTDSGASWSMARITDGVSGDVQGPDDMFPQPNGNAATAVVWNPVRKLFIAAVRYHGYYQSADGATWTRMTAQPGTRLTKQACPTKPGTIGSTACPIFRGALAVNPTTADTFAWTVDASNQDQGIWQDKCSISNGKCSGQTLAFTKLNTAALETGTSQGSATIANGDYNLVLAAVPSGQDTVLLAGANDLWKCSLANGCTWRNSTNAKTCISAQVAGYQHALAWNASNPQEIFVGNDGGLWRSMDAINETGPPCDASDASHFANLNGGLGSLAEVASMSQDATSPYTIMAGLGVNGTAGVKSVSGPEAQWPQILGGDGGTVAIDPVNPSNWYVNNHAGVSIHRCSQLEGCDAAGFGVDPVVNNADVSSDGNAMVIPASFVIDPLDPSQVLVGTCRVWRGPADGTHWTSSNAISPFLDGMLGKTSCTNDALIRTIAALPLKTGGEVIYVGMYGAADGGSTKAGHVFKAILDPAASSMPVWQDLTLNPVTNDAQRLNYYGLDISSIFVDPHDMTGNTVYVTVQGFPDPVHNVRVAYSSSDGGAHWRFITSNLPSAPANSIVIDPLDANTAYIATDIGVYSTRQIADCGMAASHCWSVYGTGLPQAPVAQLSAASGTASANVLTAATYGRGVWQIPLWTAGTQPTTATVVPGPLTFAPQTVGTTSDAQTLTITNTGGIALTASIGVSGDFSETDNCSNSTISPGSSCTIQVSFTPSQSGERTGQLTISANVPDGQIVVALGGTGISPGLVSLTPGSLSFGQVAVGSTSSPLPVTAENAGGAAVSITSLTASSPFAVATNACGSSLAANSDCGITVVFKPTRAGDAGGTLTVVDAAGTQTVALTGTGAAVATDVLSPSSLTFQPTASGQLSAAQSVVLTNNGDLPLNSIAVTASAGFQASDNCGGSLAGHASCAINVMFAPTQVGNQSGTLRVSDALQTQTVSLSGTGLLPPALGVSPSLISFAARPAGSASAPSLLDISNIGGAAMANVGFQITGPAATSFSIASTTCGVTLAAGSSCSAQVVFTPAAAGASTATLIVSSSTVGVAAIQVPLNGTGQAASGLLAEPAQMSFTEPTLGQTSRPQTATITNSSNISANELTFALMGPFSLTQNTCGTSLPAGSSCTTGVAFTPVSNGVVTGSLTVGSSAFVGRATIALSGTGGAAGAVQIQPGVLTFGTTAVGFVSNSLSIKITNSGTVPLADLSISVSNGFRVQSSQCSIPFVPGATCDANVTFAPTTAGPQSGMLTVSSTGLAASVQAPLSGMGFDFSASLTGGSNQAVASGQTARFTLALAPMSGSSGTFSFQCDSVPTHASCTFNPAIETVSANTTGSVTVQIATGQATTSSLILPPSIGAKTRVLPLVLGMILVPLASRRRRKALLFCVMLVCLAAGVASCSGGGGGTGGTAAPPAQNSNSTPPGSYVVGVTATANGVSHKVTLSLIVD